MKGFDTLKVKSAVKNRNKFNLSCSHLTTMNFGEIVPLYAEETVPGDKFSIGSNFFSRMAPLVKPTYGKFQFKTIAGFVPYHQLAVDAEAWLAGKTTFEGMTPHQRHITVRELWSWIVNDLTSQGTATNNDCSYTKSDGTIGYRVFTTKGKYWMKIMNALGYTIPQGVDLQTSSAWDSWASSTKLSAYPVLAFLKLYNDYMSQSQRYNSSVLSTSLQNIKYNVANNSLWTNTTGALKYTGLTSMFNEIRLNYENDYFTSAWQEPNNALGTGESISSVGVPSAVPAGASVGQLNYDNILTQTGGTTLTLGQRALDFLKDFDNWVRRNNYSGSRVVQQVYSRFGIKTDDYRSHYAHVITTDSQPIQVGDVTATNQASTVTLGDYAGKGILSSGSKFSYDASDYGIIIILGYFTVTPMNSYGFDRKVLRNSPLDYYTPEFDGLGAEAIPLMEYFENPLGTADSDTTFSYNIFGFTERYNSYRFGRDKITGEFRNYNNTNGMNVWHTGRLLNSVRKAGNLVAQSSSVNTLPQTNSAYNRIFSITSGDVDHFYLTCQFSVSAIRPMMSLNQVPRLGEGDTVVPRNGNVIS